MNNKILDISGVECYEVDGTAYLKLETVARGLGFITVAASGNECVRWNTVYTYLNGLGVVTSCNGTDYRSMCPEYIPENVFYRLAMKAKNEVAAVQ
jgi:anti-repressor protein